MLDGTDQKILNRLQADSRQSIADIADAVGLSKSACHRRIQRLERQRYITGYFATVDPKKVGYALTFVVEITLQGQSDQILDAFEASVIAIPEVQVCQLMTGDSDYLLRVVAKTMEDYERIHRRLAQLPGVQTMKSASVLRAVKTDSRILL